VAATSSRWRLMLPEAVAEALYADDPCAGPLALDRGDSPLRRDGRASTPTESRSHERLQVSRPPPKKTA
jgi:hypothetical protein